MFNNFLSKLKAKVKLKFKYGFTSTLFKALLSSYKSHEVYKSVSGEKFLVIYIPDDEIPQVYGLTSNQIFMVSINFFDHFPESAVLAGELEPNDTVNMDLIIFTTEQTRIQLSTEIFHAMCEHEIGHLKLGHFLVGKHLNDLKKEKQADEYAAINTNKSCVLGYLDIFLTYDKLNKDSFRQRKTNIEHLI